MAILLDMNFGYILLKVKIQNLKIFIPSSCVPIDSYEKLNPELEGFLKKQGHNSPDCEGTFHGSAWYIKHKRECALNEEMILKYKVPKCNPEKEDGAVKKAVGSSGVKIWVNENN